MFVIKVFYTEHCGNQTISKYTFSTESQARNMYECLIDDWMRKICPFKQENFALIRNDKHDYCKNTNLQVEFKLNLIWLCIKEKNRIMERNEQFNIQMYEMAENYYLSDSSDEKEENEKM